MLLLDPGSAVEELSSLAVLGSGCRTKFFLLIRVPLVLMISDSFELRAYARVYFTFAAIAVVVS